MEAVIIRQVMLAGALLGSLLQPAAIRPLDNEYVRVTRNGGPCDTQTRTIDNLRALTGGNADGTCWAGCGC